MSNTAAAILAAGVLSGALCYRNCRRAVSDMFFR
jgi:hypothetical protein